MKRGLKYLVMWGVINGFIAAASGAEDPVGWTLVPSLVLTSLVYVKRHRPHLLRRRRTGRTARDVLAPAHLFMNQKKYQQTYVTNPLSKHRMK